MIELICYANRFGKKFVLSFVIFVYCISTYSQGAWDINYVPINSLNTTFIGKEIRIDFKASNIDSVSGVVKLLAIRKLLSTKDTVSLSIDSKLIKFVERWKIYVDHGVLADQYLESVEDSMYIRRMFLESINEDSLVLQAMVCLPDSKSEMKEKILISKSVIKGLLFSISE